MIRYVVLVFALISFVPSKGQNIKFEHYNDKDGLSHNSVRRIVQDENGFLWLGTFSGLNRFDGYQFKSFMSTSGEDNTMNNDDITVLLHDDKTNNLWIGTRKGLTLLDRKTGLFTTCLTITILIVCLTRKFALYS